MAASSREGGGGVYEISFQPDEELSEFFTKIWELDNKCSPGQDFGIDLQGYAGYQSRDFAKDNLFEWFHEEDIFSRPTYADHSLHSPLPPSLLTLLVTSQVPLMRVKNPPMRLSSLILLFLVSCLSLLPLFCFSDQDSSSFEHVFVGETKQEGMIGLHNWLQYYLQEKAGNIDYQGYKRRCTVLDDEVDRIICTKFLWRGRKGKAACSMFLGSSPEFDIAVFSTCFLMGKIGHCDYQIGEYEVEVVVYSFGSVIGTAYIVPARMDEDDAKK
ncbi:poly(U)-specific endoribonuclease-A [Octopus bimaculoides]|nr:poly(U)-specific endoribonuclease-A [Octopus bimaculoides]